MNATDTTITLEITRTDDTCPVGETVGKRNRAEQKVPVLSCEGPCIRGEIARLAANMVAKEEPFRRGCHGELLTVPGSAIAEWITTAEKVVLIDGCFLRCHGRVLENLVGPEKLVQFDALSYYRKYTEHFDIDAVPEGERKAAARQVAEAVLAELRKTTGRTEPAKAACGASAAPATSTGCGCS
jgi:DGC domain-containing protein